MCILINSFAGDVVLAEFMDRLVQEHQRKEDLVSIVIKSTETSNIVKIATGINN